MPLRGCCGVSRHDVSKRKRFVTASWQSPATSIPAWALITIAAVSIYLVNGIKLQGQIDSFDQFVVLLKNTVNQMVYKHAISTVVPARPVTHLMPSPAGVPEKSESDESAE